MLIDKPFVYVLVKILLRQIDHEAACRIHYRAVIRILVCRFDDVLIDSIEELWTGFNLLNCHTAGTKFGVRKPYIETNLLNLINRIRKIE